MELKGSVDYHDYYVTSIDKALGQPRENGDIRCAHMIEIGKMRAVYAAMAESQTKTCGNCRLTSMAVCRVCKRDYAKGDYWESANAAGERPLPAGDRP